MKTVDETYSDIIEKIIMELPFGFSRFGDGEWNCIFGKSGHNCDGHEYFPELGARLKGIILGKPKYMIGIQEMALRNEYGSDIIELTDKLKLDWFNADVLHKMSIYGRLNPLFKAFKKRRIILVGPEYLSSLSIGVRLHIVIPQINCWQEYEHVKSSLTESAEPGDLILLCAGMMSNVLVDDLQNMKVSAMDIGSLLDPYVGKISRAYHKELVL